MHYGLEISAAGACGDARTLADLAQLAEESGWDGAEQSFTHFGEVTDPKRRAEMLDEGLLSMKPRVSYVAFDCADPGSLAAFWMEALGYDEEERGGCCSVGVAREG